MYKINFFFNFILIISIIASCKSKTDSISQENTLLPVKPPCSEVLVRMEKIKPIYYCMMCTDFTLTNLTKTTKDSEGTSWTNEISGEYRFVFKETSSQNYCHEVSNLIVYKNGSIFKKYNNVEIDSNEILLVNECNDIISYSLKYKIKDLVILRVVNNYSEYFIDRKTIYKGSFQNCSSNNYYKFIN